MQPTVTLIEDLHWLDTASAEFLDHMVDARADRRSLLLLNFRPEYHAEWMQKSWYRQMPLTPLGSEAIAVLLAGRLGHDSSLTSLASPIYARTTERRSTSDYRMHPDGMLPTPGGSALGSSSVTDWISTTLGGTGQSRKPMSLRSLLLRRPFRQAPGYTSRIEGNATITQQEKPSCTKKTSIKVL